MFKLMKVFDCQEMPDDVRDVFFGNECQGNDCFVTWYIEPEYYDIDSSKVHNWLLANGATLEDGRVLIKHWW